jgi:drug/metabolite transporter (DMT)-like permease
MSREDRVRLLLAFAAVYVVWGSTYLAIRYAIESLPPFLMAGVRFVIAGLLLSLWSRARGAAWPTMKEWQTAAVIGSCMLLGGNGGVVWAEQRVPSSMAALIVAVVPLVTVLIDWLRPGGQRPDLATSVGLCIGFAGVAILVNPAAQDAARIDPLGALALLAGTVSWAAGSLYSRRKRGVESPLMAAGANMLCGGVGLLLLGTVTGEAMTVNVSTFTARSLLALLYLIVFGSIIGFTAYIWLLRHTSPARATTYAYVNPVVAILLGWSIADEPVTLRIGLAATVIISGVVAITTLSRPARPAAAK